MTEPLFFDRPTALSAGEIAALTGAAPRAQTPPDVSISGIASLDQAGPRDLTFLDNPRYAGLLATTRAGLCLTAARFAGEAPPDVAILIAREPYRAFVAVAQKLFPGALRPSSLFAAHGVAPGAAIHPSARLESGAAVDPGAVIGPGAEIGAGTLVGANAVIGPQVRIGRQCSIGAGATIIHALIGDRVIIHPGCRIGQDGFGYVPGTRGHAKVPQVGRVIIQDDVEIGAGTAIDRGAI